MCLHDVFFGRHRNPYRIKGTLATILERALGFLAAGADLVEIDEIGKRSRRTKGDLPTPWPRHIDRRTVTMGQWFLHVALLPTIFLVAYLALNWSALARQYERTADYQLIAIGAALAKHGEAFAGAYSRFGFAQPGPILFYLYGFAEKLFPTLGTPRSHHQVAQLLLNWIILLGTLSAAYRTIRPRLATPLLFLFLVALPLEAAGSGALHDVWNPSVLMLPAAALIFAAFAVVRGRHGYLLLYSVAASILSQSHVSTLLFVALTTGTLCWFVQREHGFTKNFWRWFVGSATLFVLSYLPVWIDLLTAPRGGNLPLILKFFTTPSSAAGHPIREGIQFAFSYFAEVLPIREKSWGTLLACAVALALGISHSATRRWRPLLVLTAVGVFSLFIAAVGIVGPYQNYILRYGVSVVSSAYFLATLAILGSKTALSSRLFKAFGVRMAYFAWTTLLVLTVLLLPEPFRNPPRTTSPTWSQFARALDPEKSIRYRFVAADSGAWTFMSGMALHFLRSGVPFCVDPAWAFTFGRALTCEYQDQFGSRTVGPFTSTAELLFFTALPAAIPHGYKSWRKDRYTLAWPRQ